MFAPHCVCRPDVEPSLTRPPDGYASVTGTENEMRAKPVHAKAKRGDKVAQALVANGARYGRQYVVYRRTRAYPAYLVTYKG